MAEQETVTPGGASTQERFLFITCFVALVATSFAFMIRVMAMGDWQVAFGLSETQKGEIFGAGMWPFGVSIVLFSLVVDNIGYGRSLGAAFVMHAASTLLLLTAKGYWGLYWGSILNGLAAGTVEAVINPVIASMYTKQKTKMLTILHAGWSVGFVIAGILIMAMGNVSWQPKVAIILIPTLIYGAMTLKAKFPISERVAAGIPYRDMLAECGAIGCLLVFYLIAMELNRVLGWTPIYEGAISLPSWPMLIMLIAIVGAFLGYSKSLGRPMYIMLLLVMVLLAITELGTDTWIKELMGPAMEKVGLNPGWVLIYTATIMTVLRLCIGPVEKKLRPLGVLFVSSLLAALGLFMLSGAQGVMILIWATIYGTGQCYFWPVTQGLVSEQFPKGGALTINAIGGMGMLGVGIIGAQLLGYWQDSNIDRNLAQAAPAVQQRMWTPAPEAKLSIFGKYRGLSQAYVNEVTDLTRLYDYRKEHASGGPGEGIDAGLKDDAMYQTLVRNAYNHLARPKGDAADKTYEQMCAGLAAGGFFIEEPRYVELKADQGAIGTMLTKAKRRAMATVALLPIIMACCYLGFILYFRSKGGYTVVELTAEAQPAQAPETGQADAADEAPAAS